MLLLLIVFVFISPSDILAQEEPPRCVFVPLKNCPPLFAIFKRIVTEQYTNSETLELIQSIQDVPDTTVKCCERTTCTDPMGLPGVCKNVANCPALASQLTKMSAPQEVIQDMIQRRCVGPEENSLCCSQTNSALKMQFDHKDNELNNIWKEEEMEYYSSVEQTNSSCRLSILPDPTDGCCGISIVDTQDKIYGGTKAEMCQYPWMARLLYSSRIKNNSVCSGALISDRYVLSAAHCFPSKTKFKPNGVILGQYNTHYSDLNCEHNWCTTPITKGIEEIIIHEHYYSEQKGLAHNDIALVRMDGPVAFSDNIRPICLPTLDRDYMEKKHRKNLVAAGWGHIDKGHSSNILQHVKLPFVDEQNCSKYYANKGTVTSKQMCAGGNGLDSCRGDSGGPLMYESEHGFEVVGIVSLGAFWCGTMPGLYTKVYPYKDWIIKHVNNIDNNNNVDDANDYRITFIDK